MFVLITRCLGSTAQRFNRGEPLGPNKNEGFHLIPKKVAPGEALFFGGRYYFDEPNYSDDYEAPS